MTARACALALASAALTVAAFPPLGVWPLALVMLAPLALALARARPGAAFTLTWLYSLVMALAIVRWLPETLVREFAVAPAAAWGFGIAGVAAYALVPSAAMAAFAALRPRLRPACAPLALAALYAASEWLRAGPLALPWLLASHALAPAPALLQSADALGAEGPSFLALAASAGVGFALAERRARPLALPAALWALALGYGALREATLAEGAPLRVGVVQASIPQNERWREGLALGHVEAQLALGRAQLARAGALDLVVWPETAVDAVLEDDARLLAALRREVEATSVPMLVGAQRRLLGVSNSAFLVVPRAGLIESYQKQWLVPFAEATPAWAEPLRPLLGALERGRPYGAGDEARVLRRAGVPLGTPICFEITYPTLVRAFAANGARVLVNLSNDAWFARSGYAEMHLAHAVLRAIELRTPVVRAASNGISALVDARGRIDVRLGVGARGALHGLVRANAAPSVYARFGDAPLAASLALVLAASLAPRRL